MKISQKYNLFGLRHNNPIKLVYSRWSSIKPSSFVSPKEKLTKNNTKGTKILIQIKIS